MSVASLQGKVLICDFFLNYAPGQNIDWQGACIDRERSHRVWSHPEQHLEHFTFNEGLFAAVDVVHLLQVLIIHSII